MGWLLVGEEMVHQLTELILIWLQPRSPSACKVSRRTGQRTSSEVSSAQSLHKVLVHNGTVVGMTCMLCKAHYILQNQTRLKYYHWKKHALGKGSVQQ